MPRRSKSAPDTAPSGQPWAYGVRTWGCDGESHGGFRWDLTPGARTEAPDWRPVAECGHGLHCNPWGMGDWSLMSTEPDCMIGLVRYDPALAVDLSGKIKTPWMEVVHVEPYNRLATVTAMALAKWREIVLPSLPVEASTTGHGATASTTGVRAAASTTGYGAAASTTGYGAAASTTGQSAIAASLGPSGVAKASDGGAIVIAEWRWTGGGYELCDIAAGMVGRELRGVRIKAGTLYRLHGGAVLEVEH